MQLTQAYGRDHTNSILTNTTHSTTFVTQLLEQDLAEDEAKKLKPTEVYVQNHPSTAGQVVINFCWSVMVEQISVVRLATVRDAYLQCRSAILSA